ncbi:MAG: integration host factor subunit beta [Myxococcales bacterium]|nr:integration host factor subunit beta [Myxococcales bacterium]USN50496.1 MAG: integration host factor subunit beta [Myxococcales bacterium]
MTKSELIDDIALQTPEIQRRDVELVVNTILQTMTEALSRGQRIEIRGFGSFVPKLRKSRAARNPRTGDEVQVPQKYVPFFTVGKELKERINEEPTRESLYGGNKSPWQE